MVGQVERIQILSVLEVLAVAEVPHHQMELLLLQDYLTLAVVAVVELVLKFGLALIQAISQGKMEALEF